MIERTMPQNFFISFPGLGIEPFHMDKVAFSLLGRDIAWYGLIICTGMILAFFYGQHCIKKEKISVDDYLNLLLLIVPFGIVGARLYYVLTSLEHYRGRPFIDWIAVWEGGIAIYGAIIAGILCIIGYCLYKKLSILKVLDALSAPLLIGQILGRWVNFANGEAHGTFTDLPWRMGLGETPAITEFWHPTFLYESLWNLGLFLVIHFFLYKRKKFDGEIFYFYAAFYGIGRGFIELLRTDSLYIPGTALRISSVLGFVCFAVFGTLLILKLAQHADAPYVFATATAEEAATTEEATETDASKAVSEDAPEQEANEPTGETNEKEEE